MRGSFQALRAAPLLLALAACNSPGAMGAVSELGGHVAGAAIGAAASGSPRRRDSYEFRTAVARARDHCANETGRVRVVVTGGASHLDVRSPDGVRLVHYADCQLEWLDGCDARDGATYSARWKQPAEGARIVDVADEVDLYERLPGAALPLVARVHRGARLHVELIGETMRETARTFARGDLAATEPCALATHWVAAVEHGALRLNVDPSPRLEEHELDAQKELELGSYAACRRGETDACDAVVAITLTPIPRAAGR